MVGVLLEFNKDGVGSLSFYLNGILLGKAFDNMAAGTYYPSVTMIR